jgi:shikimate dehydrogenase
VADRFCLAGVMGWPVMHSRSPILHNHWMERHGLIGRYLPLAIEETGLERALRALPALGFAGCNLTIPHKEKAMALVDHLDPTATRIGAVNCVIVQPDGSLAGTNTDGFGYIASIEEADPSWRADAGPITLLGAGGAARAILVGLLDKGAREIRLTNRTADRAEALTREFGGESGGSIKTVPWSARVDALEGCAMLINSTSQGMQGKEPLSLDLSKLPPSALVSDAVYVPMETELLAAARARGNRTVNGLGMLLHQARPAFQAWFGVMPEVTPDLRRMIEATL